MKEGKRRGYNRYPHRPKGPPCRGEGGQPGRSKVSMEARTRANMGTKEEEEEGEEEEWEIEGEEEEGPQEEPEEEEVEEEEEG